jgi:CheY-like chemotaxis protein
MLPDDRVNVLLVDDQPAKLLAYEAILQDLGENLISASSAGDVLQTLLKTDVAVVLMDVCMPELDGFELAEMIRDHPRFRQTAIIFVSAIYLTDVDRMRGYEIGAVDYVPVPVIPEVLRAKVKVFAELFRKTRQLEQLFVKDTNIKTCAVDGISVQTSVGFVAGVLDRVRLEGLPTGLVIGNNAFISVRDSVINLSTSTGVSISGAGGATGSFDNVMINNNPTGINVGAGALLNLSSCTLESNSTAISSAAPQANLRSSGNNRLLGNTSDGATLTVILQK